MTMRARAKRAAAGLVAAAAICGCTAGSSDNIADPTSSTATIDSGSGTPPSNTSTVSTGSAPPASVPRPIDDSTPVVAPVADGLPSISEPDPEIVSGVLDNGLRYLIRRNDSPGRRVEMRLAVDAGSGLEADDQGGGAHYLEHMLFNGTERYPRNELIDVLRSFGAAFGADINASTGYDETIYQLTMSTDDADVVATASTYCTSGSPQRPSPGGRVHE